MKKTRLALLLVALLLAVNAALLVVQPGAALPRSLGAYFFGPKLVRAEVVMKDGATAQLYRVDRGRVRAVSAASITLLELDGTVVTVPVAPNAEILIDGRPGRLSAVRRNRVAVTVRNGDLPAESVRVTRR